MPLNPTHWVCNNGSCIIMIYCIYGFWVLSLTTNTRDFFWLCWTFKHRYWTSGIMLFSDVEQGGGGVDNFCVCILCHRFPLLGLNYFWFNHFKMYYQIIKKTSMSHVLFWPSYTVLLLKILTSTPHLQLEMVSIQLVHYVFQEFKMGRYVCERFMPSIGTKGQLQSILCDWTNGFAMCVWAWASTLISRLTPLLSLVCKVNGKEGGGETVCHAHNDLICLIIPFH